MSGTKENLVIQKGSTFKRPVRWEKTSYVYKSISAISATAPIRITSTDHGIPNGWRVAISGVKGMKEVNAKYNPPRISDFIPATVVDVNTFELNTVDAQLYSAYLSGGSVVYHTPIDLSTYTARMQIRQSLTATTVVKELTTENFGLLLDNVNKTITMVLSAADTAALSISSGVYSLEMISAGGEVDQILYGSITVEKEVTRPVV